jgi:hypothetical protein
MILKAAYVIVPNCLREVHVDACEFIANHEMYYIFTRTLKRRSRFIEVQRNKVASLICPRCDIDRDLNFKVLVLINIPNHLFPELITALGLGEHIKYLFVVLKVISTHVKIVVSSDMI